MKYSKLRRNSSQRKALLRNLVSDLIIHSQIFTTESKAKELSRTFEKIITLSKKNTLSARRIVSTLLFDKKIDSETTVLQKLFEDISPKYQTQTSGYTRIIKTEPRRGDSSFMALISLV
ncbi:50S ribosomal protein L17 ['Camptotheca acuminata' phytoplasma]|uniref:50S ribosomal protein L17 n=1 Tax='Camptotheca acuminata' phytoplasma TaxID=3239192 RepID=UPI00351A1576